MGDSRFWVRRYLAEGLSVIPIPRGEKGPRLPNWQATAFTEEDFGADDNIGVRLGEPSGGLVDIDLDAPETIAAARVLLLQSQRVHGRPSKPASHYWFTCAGIKSQRFTAPNGDVLVEIRSTGGQTVLPPSTHPSGEVLSWEQEREPLAIEEHALRASVRLVAACALVARHYPAEGSRHEAAGALAGFLALQKIEPAAIERLVRTAAEIAGDREASDRARFAGDTARKASPETPTTGGTRLAELLGDEVVKRLRSWFGVRTDSAVDELNRAYFQVRVGTDELIGQEVDGNEHVIFQTPAACRIRFANQLVVVGERKNGDEILKTKFDVWLSSPRRRQHDHVGFYPPPLHAPERDYNLWHGFAIEPDTAPHPEQRCARYLAHIREVVCAGEEPSVAEFLLDVMAQKVQRPGELTEVAIVQRSLQGAGKGTLVEPYLALFGRHAITLDKTQLAVGRFNAVLSAKLVIHLDEALWPGHREFTGALKSLVTNRKLTVERKGIDAQEEDNFVQLFVSTNNKWAWPFEPGDRRALILDVSPHRKGDTAYFKAIRDEMASGGSAALLAFLQQRTITHDLRKIPRTSASAMQIVLSGDPVLTWWHAKLDRGITWPEGTEWEEFISTNDAVADYEAHCHAKRERPLPPNSFIQEWRAMLPPPIKEEQRTMFDRDLLLEARRRGEDLEAQDAQRAERAKKGSAEQTRKARRRGTVMPGLETCRRHFNDHVAKHGLAWTGATHPASPVALPLDTLTDAERAALEGFRAYLAGRGEDWEARMRAALVSKLGRVRP